MRVGCIVESRVENALVGFGDGGILPAELGVEVVPHMVERTVIYVEAYSEREHVLALDHRLVVETRIGERGARHGRDVGDDDVVAVQPEFGYRVVGRETRLAKPLFGERVAVDDYRRVLFQPLAVGFESRGFIATRTSQ